MSSSAPNIISSYIYDPIAMLSGQSVHYIYARVVLADFIHML